MLEPEIESSHFTMTSFEKEDLVNVERFMVVQGLAPVLKKLLEKRRDIGTGSQLSSKSKNLIFTMLCGPMRSISSIKVDHPFFETLFYNWRNHFTTAKHAGFEPRLSWVIWTKSCELALLSKQTKFRKESCKSCMVRSKSARHPWRNGQ